MESNISDMSRIWVMNELARVLEEHEDVKNCNVRTPSKIDIELHNVKGARTTYHKIYTIFEWVRNEKLENRGFIDSNNNSYTIELASDIPGRTKKYAVASVKITKNNS